MAKDITPSGVPRDQGQCPQCQSFDWHDWPRGDDPRRIKCHGCGHARIPLLTTVQAAD